MVVKRKASAKRHSYQPKQRIIPADHRHRPRLYGELEVYQRWHRRFLKQRADEENGTLPISVSEATTSRAKPVEVPQWRPVSNPDATLLGLPTETRLQIYGYLSSTTLIHVHSRSGHRFTWTLCKATNSDYPLLCLNPKWSGLCKESDRCTFKHGSPPEPRGLWGLAATCKLLRHEAFDQAFRESKVSIHPHNVFSWLEWMKKCAPKQLETITKVTLAGPDHYIHCPNYVFQDIKNFLPNLSAIAYQCQTPSYFWIGQGKEQFDLASRWEYWDIVESMRIFAPTITVIVEGLMWLKKRRLEDDGEKKRYSKERQGIVRMIRMGKQSYEGSGWEDADLKLEVVQPKALVEGKSNAEWRIWWKMDELKYFR